MVQKSYLKKFCEETLLIFQAGVIICSIFVFIAWNLIVPGLFGGAVQQGLIPLEPSIFAIWAAGMALSAFLTMVRVTISIDVSRLFQKTE